MEEGITVELWIKPASSTSYYPIIKLNSYYLYFIQASQLEFKVYHEEDVSSKKVNCNLDINEWNHIAATFNRSSIRIYKNGKEITDEVESPQVQDKGVASSDFDLAFSGIKDDVIDEIRIYRVPLSSAQIQKHYAEGARKRGLAIEK